MAFVFPDEAMFYIIDVLLRGEPMAPSMYVGLFSSQTPGTVPDRDAVLGDQAGVTELGPEGGYERAEVLSSLWFPAATTDSGVRTSTAANAVEFVRSTGPFSAPANGFFLTPFQEGGPALFYGNFSEAVEVNIDQAGYKFMMAPWVELRNV